MYSLFARSKSSANHISTFRFAFFLCMCGLLPTIQTPDQLPFLWLTMRSVGASVCTTQDVRMLEQGKPIERELVGGEAHAYQIALVAGQHLRIAVDQRSIDLTATLYAPDGRQIGEHDCRWSGTEPVSVVAEATGDYRLTIRTLHRTAARGNYQVRIEELRESKPQDKSRLAAEKASTEGKRLIDQANAQSLRAAKEKLEVALTLWQAIGDRFGEAQTLNGLGFLSERFGDPRRALDHYQQALQLRQTIKDLHGESETLRNIAAAYSGLSERQKALDYYRQALLISRALGELFGEAMIHNNMSAIYLSLGDYQKSRDSFNQALPLMRAAGDPQGQAQTLIGLGAVHNLFGEWQKALDYFNQALQHSQAAENPRGIAASFNNLGATYKDLGEWQKSLDHYRQALPFFRAATDRRGEATTLNNLGTTSSLLGERQKALEYYGQAIAVWRAISDRFGEAQTLLGIGRAYDELGEKQKALDHYNQALSFFRAVGSRRWEASALHNLGALYDSRGDKQTAFDLYSQALTLWQAMGDRNGEAKTRSQLARVARDRDRLDEARNQIEAALNIIESLRIETVSHDLRSTYFASVRESYDFYIGLLMQLHEQHPSEKLNALALQTSERVRARSLFELLAEARISLERDVPAELKQRERANQARLSHLNSQLLRAYSQASPDQKTIKALNEELSKAESEREQLAVELRQTNPKYAEIYYPMPLRFEAIQALLDKQTLILEYALGQEGSTLFVVSQEGIQSYRLPKSEAIGKLAQEVRAAMSQPGQRNFSRYAQASRQLYELLVAPAAGTLVGKRHLLIVPDGALYNLPFEALLTEAVVGGQTDYRKLPYLLKQWTVSYIPSANVLAMLRKSQSGSERPPASQKEFVAFADPIFELDKKAEEQKAGGGRNAKQVVRNLIDEGGRLELSRLTYARREVAAIARMFDPQKVEVYLQEAAKEENVKANEHLSYARRIHFATHGLVSAIKPQSSSLVLTLDDDPREDGLLQAYEVFNLKLRADLVTLSACQTGMGKELRGEGVIGLTRAFMFAGASSVMVSLWQVSDRSTADLMIRFYQHLNRKQSKTEALRRAKLELIGRGHYAHPYYWAPFILTGEPK